MIRSIAMLVTTREDQPRIQRGLAAAHVFEGRLCLQLGFRRQDVAPGAEHFLQILEVRVRLPKRESMGIQSTSQPSAK